MEQARKVWIQTSLQQSHTDCLSVGQLLLFATGALLEAVDFICILYIMKCNFKSNSNTHEHSRCTCAKIVQVGKKPAQTCQPNQWLFKVT